MSIEWIQTMKFEEALPLMRNGSKFKCANLSGYYIVCKKSLFGMDLGTGICNISTENNSSDIFHWGIDGNSLLSNEWEIYNDNANEEIKKIESILEKAIEQTIFNFFMSITKPFTPENAFLPPLSKPLSEKIINMLKKFFDEPKV